MVALTMAGLMERPAACRAATGMLEGETVVVVAAGVGWATASGAAVTCAVAVCVGWEVTC